MAVFVPRSFKERRVPPPPKGLVMAPLQHVHKSRAASRTGRGRASGPPTPWAASTCPRGAEARRKFKSSPLFISAKHLRGLQRPLNQTFLLQRTRHRINEDPRLGWQPPLTQAIDSNCPRRGESRAEREPSRTQEAVVLNPHRRALPPHLAFLTQV